MNMTVARWLPALFASVAVTVGGASGLKYLAMPAARVAQTVRAQAPGQPAQPGQAAQAGGGTVTNCWAQPMPGTITITASGFNGGAATVGWNGATATLTYNGSAWVGRFGPPGYQTGVEFGCGGYNGVPRDPAIDPPQFIWYITPLVGSGGPTSQTPVTFNTWPRPGNFSGFSDPITGPSPIVFQAWMYGATGGRGVFTVTW